jgi:phosphoglycolate phosphatase
MAMPVIQCGAVQFHNIQAVLFDKDGTLADSQLYLGQLGHHRADLIEASVPGVRELLLKAFGLEGDRLDPAGLLAVGTRLENEIATAACVAQAGLAWMESLNLVQLAFLQADQLMPSKAPHTPLFRGALTLLKELKSGGIQIGIVSSDSPSHVQDFVEWHQLTSLVQIALGSKPELSKPDPRLVYQACQILEVHPAETLIVGDSAIDIQIAQNAATAGCVGVGWSGATRAMLQECNSFVQRFSDIQVIV